MSLIKEKRPISLSLPTSQGPNERASKSVCACLILNRQSFKVKCQLTHLPQKTSLIEEAIFWNENVSSENQDDSSFNLYNELLSNQTMICLSYAHIDHHPQRSFGREGLLIWGQDTRESEEDAKRRGLRWYGTRGISFRWAVDTQRHGELSREILST